ncbi:Hypothetical protein FKW44_007939 [Caligus rogercresseyi]|uniref:Uncharacterized protein n=1 Tax=Caligus rogercresseyi TaxID=217165 RepID=A0A7T8KFL0_CALRO|nr:Hypothetical protein FKW44_007939 [Caligus rogercresseyi]
MSFYSCSSNPLGIPAGCVAGFFTRSAHDSHLFLGSCVNRALLALVRGAPAIICTAAKTWRLSTFAPFPS